MLDWLKGLVVGEWRPEFASKGVCHLCAEEKPVIFCGKCGHWFCEECRTEFFPRGIEWVMEKVGGKREGCCGPKR